VETESVQEEEHDQGKGHEVESTAGNQDNSILACEDAYTGLLKEKESAHGACPLKQTVACPPAVRALSKGGSTPRAARLGSCLSPTGGKG
jgi:hypothetical protein